MQMPDRWIHRPGASFGASSTMKASKATGVIKKGIDYHRWVYKTLQLQCRLNHPEWKLHIEPWFRNMAYKERSPDAVLVNEASGRALVIEVKLNWESSRDAKLINEYLPIVRSAFDVATWPLLIVGHLRGFGGEALLGLGGMMSALTWAKPQPTPVLLLPKRG